MSLDVLLGYTGLPSLGHAAYFGVGAYVVAILATEHQMGLARLPRRRRGAGRRDRGGLRPARHPRHRHLLPHDHAGARHGGLGARLPLGVAHQGRQRHRGRPAADAARPRADRAAALLLLRLACAALAWALLGLLVVSPFGLGLRGHPRQRVAHAGPRLQRVAAQVHRLRALGHRSAASRACSGPTTTASSAPPTCSSSPSVETLLMVALGGSGTLIGPALGAGIIVFLKNFVSVYTKRWLLILGGVYIGVILFAPPASSAPCADGADDRPLALHLDARLPLLRRPPGRGRRDAHRSPGRAPRAHRPQRRGEDHALQPHRGRDAASARARIALFGRDVTHAPAHRRAALGPRAHVPDHQPLPRSERAGELPARRAGPPAGALLDAAPGGRATRPCSSARAPRSRRLELEKLGDAVRAQPLPRRAAPARDRAGPGRAAARAAARRAHRRPLARGVAADGRAAAPARSRDHRADDRARHGHRARARPTWSPCCTTAASSPTARASR